MENNTQNQPQPTPPKRKAMAPKDLILIALAVLVMVRIDWHNMNSFHYLILFLLFLCFMLRWTNMRKEAQKQELLKKKAEYEAKQRAAQNPAPAEEFPTEAMTVDGEPVPPSAEETTEKDTDA